MLLWKSSEARSLRATTYAELRRMAESVGRWLHEQKLQPGSRCAILADNHPRWVAAYLGIIAAGHTAVPLDTAFHADQVAKLLADSGSFLLFCDGKHGEIAEQGIRAELRSTCFDDSRASLWMGSRGRLPLRKR